MDARTAFDRGLITLEELVEEHPEIIGTRWYTTILAEMDDRARDQGWKCRVCGNQNKEGRISDLCWYHARYPEMIEADTYLL